MANGQYARIDRVDIGNLDKNCDTTLYWPDTLLTLQPLGLYDISKNPAGLRVFQNVPNPISGNTKILIYIPENGNVTIEVSRMNGKLVSSFSQELKRGYHSFIFSSGSSGIYLFTAIFNSVRESIKMVCSQNNPQSGCSLTYHAAENEPAILKSSGSSGNFIFSVGDSLELTGYHGSLTATIKDVPENNKSYTFSFSPAIVPCPGIPTVTYLGQTYNTVQIGSQCWLRENLNVGTRIDGSQEQTNNGIIEKYCYNDDVSSCAVYGGLYQWDEMMQYIALEGSQGICPTGWHVPSDSEYTILTDYLGGESVAGGKMKEAGTDHWLSPNTGGTNSSGFTALPGGAADNTGHFVLLHYLTNLWTSTHGNMSYACYENLYYDSEQFNQHGYDPKTAGFSVRCLEGNGNVPTTPVITTTFVSDISQSTATSGGTITNDGGAPVTIRGICWSTSPNPTTSDKKTNDGSGIGSFVSNLTGMTSRTLYYARAYAINIAGTAYGDQKQFTTLSYPLLNVPGNYQGWNPADSSTVIASMNFNDKYEGYLWFPDSAEFKYAIGSWAQNWGDNNGDGTLEPGGVNILCPIGGYYKLNANLVFLTHSFVKTEWGVIGTSTPGGWSSDENLVYDFASRTWKVTMYLTAGELKFRANDSWELNYGDNNADGSLEQDGANIVVNTAGTYIITLDLSIPEYRYNLKIN